MDINASMTDSGNSLQELYAAGCYRLDIGRRISMLDGSELDEAATMVNARIDALQERWDSLYSDLGHIEDIKTHGTWALTMMEEMFDEISVLNAEQEIRIKAIDVSQTAMGYRAHRLLEQARDSDGWQRLTAVADDYQSTVVSDETANPYREQLNQAQGLMNKLTTLSEQVDIYLLRNAASTNDEDFIETCAYMQTVYDELMSVLHEEQ